MVGLGEPLKFESSTLNFEKTLIVARLSSQWQRLIQYLPSIYILGNNSSSSSFCTEFVPFHLALLTPFKGNRIVI